MDINGILMDIINVEKFRSLFFSGREGFCDVMITHVMSMNGKYFKHTIKSFSLDLTSAPGIQAVSNWQEVVNGKVVAVSGVAITGTSGNVSMSNIALDDKETVRIFTADVKTNTVAESFV